MGDEVLMKKIVIYFGVAITVTLFADNSVVKGNRLALVENYQMMFDRIGQKRVGAEVTEIESVKSPFVRLKRKQEEQQVIVKKDGTKVAIKPAYMLQAIVNDHVRISGKWYKLHDKVNEYTLNSIEVNAVVLKNDQIKKRLMLRKKNEKITIN